MHSIISVIAKLIERLFLKWNCNSNKMLNIIRKEYSLECIGFFSKILQIYLVCLWVYNAILYVNWFLFAWHTSQTINWFLFAWHTSQTVNLVPFCLTYFTNCQLVPFCLTYFTNCQLVPFCLTYFTNCQLVPLCLHKLPTRPFSLTHITNSTGLFLPDTLYKMLRVLFIFGHTLQTVNYTILPDIFYKLYQLHPFYLAHLGIFPQQTIIKKKHF